MPKVEWKRKGLRKLRHYCDVCQQQCGDALGYQRHIQSKKHLANMAAHASNPHAAMEQNSVKYKRQFLDLLERRFGTRKVLANSVNNELVKDRDHIHMKSTIWTSLGEFVQFLGKEGDCEVEHSERGWWITLKERDEDLLARQKEEDELRAREAAIEARIERDQLRAVAAAVGGGGEEEVGRGTELRRSETDAPVKIDLESATLEANTGEGGGGLGEDDVDDTVRSAFFDEEEEDGEEGGGRERGGEGDGERGGGGEGEDGGGEEVVGRKRRRRSVGDDVEVGSGAEEKKRAKREEEVVAVEKAEMMKGVVVIVRNSALAGGKYDGKKGCVREVDVSSGKVHVKMKDSGDVLALAPKFIETSLPKPGALVLCLVSPHRGQVATLEKLYPEAFAAKLRLLDTGKAIRGIPYDHFSRIDKEWVGKQARKSRDIGWKVPAELKERKKA